MVFTVKSESQWYGEKVIANLMGGRKISLVRFCYNIILRAEIEQGPKNPAKDYRLNNWCQNYERGVVTSDITFVIITPWPSLLSLHFLIEMVYIRNSFTIALYTTSWVKESINRCAMWALISYNCVQFFLKWSRKNEDIIQNYKCVDVHATHCD